MEVIEYEQLLNKKQIDVVEELDKNILLVAAAGTGKTNTLTYRISNIIQKQKALPTEILALTFTNKACNELKQRITGTIGRDGSSVVVKTFHSFCFNIIKEEAKNIDVFNDFTILDDEDTKEIVKEINRNNYLDSALQNFINIVKEYRCVYDIFSKNRIEDYNNVIKRLYKDNEEKIEAICRNSDYSIDYDMKDNLLVDGKSLVMNYNIELQNQHALDFNDLIGLVFELFKSKSIVDKWRKKFRYINIDEMQDTSEVEYKIISSLFYGNNVLLCGDYFQTIYEWRGSAPKNIINSFKKNLNPEIIVFNENYRSTQTLLNASYEALYNMFDKEVAEIYTDKFCAITDIKGEQIIFKDAIDFDEEASFIFREIQKLTSEFPPKICILTRSNKYNQELSSSFEKLNDQTSENEQLDFLLVDEFKFFRRQEVKDIIAFLRITINPYDSNSLMRILKRFTRGIGKNIIEHINSLEVKKTGIKLTDFVDCNTHKYGDPFAILINEFYKSNIIVFDVESTGINTTNDEIIQIAAIKIDSKGNISDKLERFIKPRKSVGESYLVHGFDDAFLEAHGEEPEIVLNDFLNFSSGSVVVGHNVCYDIDILTSQLCRHMLPKPNFLGSLSNGVGREKNKNL